MDGFVLVDKPEGLSSFAAVSAVRRRLGRPKAGHAGTLDPFATGVLLVLVGRATRLMPWVVGHDKRYEMAVGLGASSSSDDRTGQLTPVSDRSPSKDEVERALQTVLSRSTQVPPRVSAIHVDGARAYARARREEEFSIPERVLRVHEYELVEYDPAARMCRMTATVGTGTYLRSIARDLGQELGCGGYAEQLRRTAIGVWTQDQSVALDDVEPDHVRPMGELVPSLDRVQLQPHEARAFAFGQTVCTPAAASAEVAVFAGERRLVGIARRDDSGTLVAQAVLETDPRSIT